jgi:hypothetical protein
MTLQLPPGHSLSVVHVAPSARSDTHVPASQNWFASQSFAVHAAHTLPGPQKPLSQLASPLAPHISPFAHGLHSAPPQLRSVSSASVTPFRQCGDTQLLVAVSQVAGGVH